MKQQTKYYYTFQLFHETCVPCQMECRENNLLIQLWEVTVH